MAGNADVYVELGIDPRKLEAGLNIAQRKLKRTVAGWSKRIFAPLLGAGALKGAASNYIETADSIGKLSRELGISVDAVQEWQRAAGDLGISVQAVEGLFRDMRDQVAAGKGALIDFAKASGVYTGSDVEESLLQLSNAYRKLDEVGRRKFLDKFGWGHEEAVLLEQGSTALIQLLDKQREFGLLTEEDIKISREYKQALRGLQATWTVFSAEFGRVIVPKIQKGFEKITAFFRYLQKHSFFLKSFFTVLAAGLTLYFLPAITRVGAALLKSPLTWFLTALLAIGLALEDLYVWSKRGDSALPGLWEWLFDSPEKFQKLLDEFKEFGDALKRFGDALSVQVPKYLQGLWEIMKGLVTLDYQKIKDGFGMVREAIRDLWKELKELIGFEELAGKALEKIGLPRDFFKGSFAEDVARRFDPAYLLGGPAFISYGVGSALGSSGSVSVANTYNQIFNGSASPADVRKATQTAGENSTKNMLRAIDQSIH